MVSCEWGSCEGEDDTGVMVIEECASEIWGVSAEVIYWPIFLGKYMDKVGTCSRQFIVHGPRGSENTSTTLTSTVAGQNADDIASIISMERL